MSGGVMAAAGLLATLAVCESVVPRFYAEWRHRRRKAKEAKEEKKRADESAGKVAPAPEPVSRPPVPPPPRHEDAPPAVAEESKADRLWAEARRMPHNVIPDPVTDGGYLAKIRGAAALGHLEAMAKLGEYAFRRGALVEAYYWTALAELKGASLLAETLRLIEALWMQAGCPTEYDNLYDDFSERQGSFARALLRIRCGVDVPAAWARLEELAGSGQEGARRFCLSSPGCALRCTAGMSLLGAKLTLTDAQSGRELGDLPAEGANLKVYVSETLGGEETAVESTVDADGNVSAPAEGTSGFYRIGL